MLKEAEVTALKVMVKPFRSKGKRGATKSEKFARGRRRKSKVEESNDEPVDMIAISPY